MDDQILAGAITSIGPLGTIAVIVIRLLLDMRKKIDGMATDFAQLNERLMVLHREHLGLVSRIDEVWESATSIKIDLARLDERVANRTTGPFRVINDEPTGRVQ